MLDTSLVNEESYYGIRVGARRVSQDKWKTILLVRTTLNAKLEVIST
jgi:hypothetical protein